MKQFEAFVEAVVGEVAAAVVMRYLRGWMWSASGGREVVGMWQLKLSLVMRLTVFGVHITPISKTVSVTLPAVLTVVAGTENSVVEIFTESVDDITVALSLVPPIA